MGGINCQASIYLYTSHSSAGGALNLDRIELVMEKPHVLPLLILSTISTIFIQTIRYPIQNFLFRFRSVCPELIYDIALANNF